MILTDKLFFLPFLFSFLIAFISTPLVIKIGWKLGLAKQALKRQPKDTHSFPVPRGGGLVVFLALLLTSLIFLPLDKHLTGILLGAFFATVVGLFDDRLNLNPYLRLFTCFLAGGAVVGAGIGITFITNPFDGLIFLNQPQINFSFLGQTHTLRVLSSLFALLWIAWCMNFVGWSGGVEGQFPGFVAIAAATIGALSLRYSADITQWPVIILAAITTGAYLGFLPFNFHPQKIMPGYSGKSLGGFLLGVLSILSTAKIGTLIVVLGVPLIDACYSIARRILAGRSPFWGDRGHLHHRLLDLGWGKRKIALFYWAVTAFLGFLALNLNSRQKFYTIIMVAVLFGGFLLCLRLFTTFSSRQDQNNG